MRHSLSRNADAEFHDNGWLEITVKNEVGGGNVRLVAKEKELLRALLNREADGAAGLAKLTSQPAGLPPATQAHTPV